MSNQLKAWDRVLKAREAQRPKASDYIENLIDDFIELHGDRNYGDDKAFICGIGYLEGIPVTVIAQQKGKKTKENMESYNIQFKGTSSIEHKEYTEKLGEWYKDFYKKDFEDLGDTIVWHRIIQYYVHDKSKLESGSYAIYKINKDLYDKIINGEVSEEELIIERVKLSDEIDYNCFYFISIDYAL